jgi:hypothetical protein
VGTIHGANIITGIMTTFGERKFRRTLNNFKRHTQHNMGNQKIALSHFRPEVDIEHTTLRQRNVAGTIGGLGVRGSVVG